MLDRIKKGLVVSCQALVGEPLHSSFIMSKLALASKQAGAVGIRSNSPEDILAIKEEVDLPVIGIYKIEYPDTPVYITGTLQEVKALAATSCEMIAVDATNRPRHEGQSLTDFLSEAKKIAPNQLFMADIATVEEAIEAEKIGFDCVSTTLMGYTEESAGYTALANEYEKLKEVLEAVTLPVIAEGHVSQPQQAWDCLKLGAHAVVVGGAITRPKQIAEGFIEKIKQA